MNKPVRHVLRKRTRDAWGKATEARRSLGIRWAGRVGQMPRPEKWLFIVGCYNSGTTLLHDLLATHPLIGSLPAEGQFCTDQLPVPRKMGLGRAWALEPERFHLDETSTDAIDVTRLKRQWGASFDDPALPVLMEKSPPNAARTRWLQRHFESAHFIGIVRNGFAVAEGLHRKRGHPMDIAAKQWVRSNEVMLEDFDHLERKLLIRYEDFTGSPKVVLAELFGFLGVEASDDYIAGLAEARHAVHQLVSPITNMNDRSIAGLQPSDLDTICRVAEPLLRRLGYSA